MAWSDDFVRALETGAPLTYTVERLLVSAEPGADWLVQSDAIGIENLRVTGTRVAPRGWTSTLGGFTFDLVGPDAISAFHAACTRGTVLALYASTSGSSMSGAERIACGQVTNIRGGETVQTVECKELPAAFRSRLVTTGSGRLFPSLASSDLTVGPAVGAATYTVTSTTGFKRQTGENGCIRVETSAGDAYYRRWSSDTATVFTIDTPGSDVAGTPDLGASIGDLVYEVGYIQGHPIDLARRVLCSTGAGTNGAYDVLPSGYSLGILDALVDHDDCDSWRDSVVTTGGTYNWQVFATEEVDDGWAWLQEMLSRAGIVLTMRQGSITIRAGMASTAATLYPDALEITDDDIDANQGLQYEGYDTGHDVEYQQVKVLTNQGESTSSSRDTTTLPTDTILEVDVSDLVYTHEADIRTEMLARLTESATRIPQRIVIPCVGLRMAQATPLDWIRLTTSRLQVRGSYPLDHRAILVDQVDVDWAARRVLLGVLVYPVLDQVFE